MRFFIVLLLLIVILPLLGTIIEVDSTGSADYITIQEGINSAEDSDTVLVHPGTYLENIDFQGKNIVLGSLFLTTGVENFISETIIDGNQNGSTVKLTSGEDSTTVLCGFTITNGSGSTYFQDGPICGGGVFFMDSQASIISCIITGNYSSDGGGILCQNSQISLKGVDIIDNYANKGGGIFLADLSEICFDQEDLCNIYLNYAGAGCEILKSYFSSAMEVYVDTFTVLNPDGYYLTSTDTFGEPLNDVTMHIQNAKIEPVNSDLYVSATGSNENSGLTEEDPLATINYAMTLVKSDSLHPNTIHIDDGLYSRLTNNNFFPVCMKGYVSIEGCSMENTILDAEHLAMHFTDYYSPINYSIRNLTFLHGTGDYGFAACIYVNARIQTDRFIRIENVTITRFNTTRNRLLETHNVNVELKNVYSINNDNSSFRPSNSNQPELTAYMENCKFSNNDQNNDIDSINQMMLGNGHRNLFKAILVNCEITNNDSYFSNYPVRCSGIEMWDYVDLTLINCTIGNNSSPNNGGPIVVFLDGESSNVEIYNSIIYGNSPSQIYVTNQYSNNPATVSIKNSLVENGIEGIENVYTWNEINWLDGNLDTDPFWVNDGEYPYILSDDSPCIDSGTLDLPDGIILPEFDLAGNPRIVGNSIDIGAYEYQDSVASYEEEIEIIARSSISNFPNPFCSNISERGSGTTINLELAESGIINLSIYNLKGQKVRTLLDAYSSKGKIDAFWDGLDESSNEIASGQYFIKLMINSEECEVIKCLLLK